jgi:hypothetical protein
LDSFYDQPRAVLVSLRLPWAIIFRASRLHLISGRQVSPFESANISVNQRLKFLYFFSNTRSSPLAARQKISFFVGDEVTSLKFLWFLKGKLETPHVVSYFFNRLLAVTLTSGIAHFHEPPSDDFLSPKRQL